MKLLIKIGGTLIDSPEARQSMARKIAAIVQPDRRVAVVHGGGKQLSRYLKEQGVDSEFRGGFRVTPPEILDAVLRILTGSVNHHLLAALRETGVQAVGLSGIDGGMVEARQLSPELGAVGEVETVDPSLLDLLTGENFLPVVACIAGGAGGAVYNVNADQMAVACAGAFKADQLVFLTDVEGVLDRDGRLISRLTAAEALNLIDTGVAGGGMEAKLRAAVAGVSKGIPEVRIVAGTQPDVLEGLLSDGPPPGSTLVLD